jgi:hypothetical protein
LHGVVFDIMLGEPPRRGVAAGILLEAAHAGETFAVAEGFAVSITAPSAHLYLADQFNLLLTSKRLNPQGVADDG